MPTDPDLTRAKKCVRKMGYNLERRKDDGGFPKEDLMILVEAFKRVRKEGVRG